MWHLYLQVPLKWQGVWREMPAGLGWKEVVLPFCFWVEPRGIPLQTVSRVAPGAEFGCDGPKSVICCMLCCLDRWTWTWDLDSGTANNMRIYYPKFGLKQSFWFCFAVRMFRFYSFRLQIYLIGSVCAGKHWCPGSRVGLCQGNAPESSWNGSTGAGWWSGMNSYAWQHHLSEQTPNSDIHNYSPLFYHTLTTTDTELGISWVLMTSWG